MKVIFVVTLVITTFSFAKCFSKVNQTKELEPRTSLEEKERTDFDLMESLTECNETFRIEMSYIEALNASGSFPDETEKTPKCYIRCVLERAGVLEDEKFDAERGAVVFALVRKTTPVDAIKDIANDCSKRSETCKCERSYQFLKCLMETEIQKYETETS